MIFIFIHDKKHDVFFIFLCFVCLFAFLPKISLQSIKKQFTFIAKTFTFVTILKKKNRINDFVVHLKVISEPQIAQISLL